MRYEVRLTRMAAKQMACLPTRDRQRILRRIEHLRDWPDHNQDVKLLKGRLDGCYRLRSGNYRVLFQVFHDSRAIVVETVGTRGSVYH